MILTWGGGVRTGGAEIKTRHGAILSTTNLKYTEVGSNRGIPGQRPPTNRLSHDTAVQASEYTRITFTDPARTAQ